MKAPAWLENIVLDGLSALLLLRLDRSPAADTITFVADVWLSALQGVATTWSEAHDAERVKKAFRRLTTLSHSWPSPAMLVQNMPSREPVQALPPPRSNTVSPDVREQIDVLVKRQRRTQVDVGRHQLLAVLAKHIGAANGASAEQLARLLNCNTRHIRALVTELRKDGEHVCGTPGEGYFMAETPEELAATCDWLRSRALKSLLLLSRMTKVSMPDLVGQLKLPT